MNERITSIIQGGVRSILAILSSPFSRIIIGFMLSISICVLSSGAISIFLLSHIRSGYILTVEDDVGASGVVVFGLAFVIMVITFPFWFWFSFKLISKLLVSRG